MTELSTTIGLANLGNTCFLNVVLQALRLSPPMGRLFLMNTPELRKDSNKLKLLEGFQILMNDFWKPTLVPGAQPTLSANGFHHMFLRTIRESGDDWHSHGQQSDAAETIQYILASLHDALYESVTMHTTGRVKTEEDASRVQAIDSWGNFFRKEYSPIVEHYHGQTQTRVICDQCQAVSTRYEPWLMLKVPLPTGEMPHRIPPNTTLTDCLNQAFADEHLDDYRCDACHQQGKATIRNRISKLPDILILSFKRFTNQMHKVGGPVEWNLSAMDFRPWMAFNNGDPFNPVYTPPIYETTTLIEHQGSFRGGHYRMYAKQPPSEAKGSSHQDATQHVWNEYDDNSIRVLSGYPGDTTNACDTYIACLTRLTSAPKLNAEFAQRVRMLRQMNRMPSTPTEEPK
jgi:ubiquitin C-terminal hydrolase